MTERSDRRYCQVKGCRRWWVYEPRRHAHRYCDKCRDSYQRKRETASPEARQRALAVNRKNTSDLCDDRVGLRGASPLPNGYCERCTDLPARKGFSFCMQCSVCERCGKNKPETGVGRCRACRLLMNAQQNVRSKRPIEKRKRAAYNRLPKVVSARNEHRIKRRSDPKYMEKELAYNRKRRRIAYWSPERVTAMARRVCARLGCTKRLSQKKRSGASYCSDTCLRHAYNARRQDCYRSDPEYRERALERSLEYGRERRRNAAPVK